MKRRKTPENIFQIVKDKDLINMLVGRTGGKTTMRILDKIIQKPYNKHQLSRILKLDYNTISYHIDILCKYNYATEEKFESNYFYSPSNKLFNNIEEYNLIKEFLNKK